MKLDRQIEPAHAVQEKGALGRIMQMFGSGDDQDEADGLSEDEVVLQKISHFILSHDLGITPVTLGSAHDFVTRSNLHLIRKIREREDAGEPINRIWLEAQAQAGAGQKSSRDGARKLEKVIEHLERNVDQLSSAAHEACDATRNYNHTLAENGRRLSESAGQEATPDVEQIVGLVAQMIDHAQGLEERLKATEDESRAMRHDLQKARQLADEDHLTGLPNRRAFENRLRLATSKGERDKPVCVGFCDIDHFKKVNDTHGHDTGDRVLRLVARHLAKATGNDCFVARHGGEEFAVLFDGIGTEEARRKLDDAREKLSQKQLKDRRTGRSVGTITFSAGIALYDAENDPGETLKAADEALYAAKQQGRNRILVSGG